MSFFYGLKKAVLDASGKEYRLNCLVAAGAITRGFQRAFRILSVQRELRELSNCFGEKRIRDI